MKTIVRGTNHGNRHHQGQDDENAGRAAVERGIIKDMRMKTQGGNPLNGSPSRGFGEKSHSCIVLLDRMSYTHGRGWRNGYEKS